MERILFEATEALAWFRHFKKLCSSMLLTCLWLRYGELECNRLLLSGVVVNSRSYRMSSSSETKTF